MIENHVTLVTVINVPYSVTFITIRWLICRRYILLKLSQQISVGKQCN